MDIIQIQRFASPVGNLILGSAGGRLCMCDWEVRTNHGGTISGRIQRYFKTTHYEEVASPIIELAIAQLEEYFTGMRKYFDMPLMFSGTEFQCVVWSELMKIPYGTILSYGELARRIQNPKAVRAVASANAANPISIFVPCHRVIGSNHKLIGYGGGLEVKRMLIDLERNKLRNLFY